MAATRLGSVPGVGLSAFLVTALVGADFFAVFFFVGFAFFFAGILFLRTALL